MCYYVLQVTLCGHCEPRMFHGPSCERFLHELDRIHHASAWKSHDNPDAENIIPFGWPYSCEPSQYNTVQCLIWCGWECRNTHDPWGHQECYAFPNGIKQHHGQKEPMGEPGATFGKPRPGVGWREEA
ncbi:hypothetical protein PG993_001184 [Apiospora rasikravindrae]|uniref:Uncharacterized protein n=1 Tax=Apiospora rasikravindrae TaxID=990691 RepID=A0ABR1UB79_9PEZI